MAVAVIFRLYGPVAMIERPRPGPPPCDPGLAARARSTGGAITVERARRLAVVLPSRKTQMDCSVFGYERSERCEISNDESGIQTGAAPLE